MVRNDSLVAASLALLQVILTYRFSWKVNSLGFYFGKFLKKLHWLVMDVMPVHLCSPFLAIWNVAILSVFGRVHQWTAKNYGYVRLGVWKWHASRCNICMCKIVGTLPVGPLVFTIPPYVTWPLPRDPHLPHRRTQSHASMISTHGPTRGILYFYGQLCVSCLVALSTVFKYVCNIFGMSFTERQRKE